MDISLYKKILEAYKDPQGIRLGGWIAPSGAWIPCVEGIHHQDLEKLGLVPKWSLRVFQNWNTMESVGAAKLPTKDQQYTFLEIARKCYPERYEEIKEKFLDTLDNRYSIYLDRVIKVLEKQNPGMEEVDLTSKAARMDTEEGLKLLGIQ